MSRQLTPLTTRDIPEPRPVVWSDVEPARLARDLAEVSHFAPALAFHPAGDGSEHGHWVGELPRWPFDRPAPEGLDALIGAAGLKIVLTYSAAHPMMPPAICPVEPEPTVLERTQSAWHVAPNGSLCLLQSDGEWKPEASLTELLLKACGWRIEYALMKAGRIEHMSVNGIVSDPSLDPLIALTAAKDRAEPRSSDQSAGTDVEN